jgi:hypothetical protein
MRRCVMRSNQSIVEKARYSIVGDVFSILLPFIVISALTAPCLVGAVIACILNGPCGK